MKFNSKIDIWLGVLIVAAAILISKAAYFILLQPNGVFEAAVLVVLGAILPVWILISTNYHLIDEYLWINSGPFRWKIPTLSITRIGFSKSWKSSPALSLDRIVIEYDGGKLILISPKEKQKFMNAIKSNIIHNSRRRKIIKKP